MGNDPILSLSQSNVQTTTLLTPLIGRGAWNRTKISEFKARCDKPLHYSPTELAGPLRIELRIAESKSAVIPFNYKPTKENFQGTLCEQVWKLYMERVIGIEPTTITLATWRSTS